MLNTLKIKFAPLNVPIERRLQTLATAAFFLIILFGTPTAFFLSLILFIYGSQWIKLLLLGYLVFVYFDRNTCRQGGRRVGVRFMRNLSWWKYFANYFPVKLVKTVDLNPNQNYMFCSFPHGLLATGVSTAFGTNALNCSNIFPGLDFRIITLDQNFTMPIFREFLCFTGSCSCNAESIEYLIQTKPKINEGPTEDPVYGRAVVIIVGGAAEAFNSKPGTYYVILNRRKGFVKLAIKNGTHLVPVFSFGETDLYDQVRNPEGSLLRRIQEYFKKITGVAPIIPIGRGFFQYSFGFLPQRRPVTVVVGAPLEIPKIENPTSEDVNKYHALFTEKLIELFETNKSKYLKNHENITLHIE